MFNTKLSRKIHALLIANIFIICSNLKYFLTKLIYKLKKYKCIENRLKMVAVNHRFYDLSINFFIPFSKHVWDFEFIADLRPLSFK